MPRRASLIVFLGLAIALVFVTGISAGAAQEVQEKRDEVASAQDRLADIRMEEEAASSVYSSALYKMNQLNGQIAQATEDLDAAKKRLAEAQADLEERASQVYKSGNVAFMDVLVGVDDFSEFATRLDLWVRLLGQERAKVEAVEKAKDELAAQKRDLTDQREQRVAAVEKAIEQRERAEGAEKEAEEYLASLNDDLREEIQARQDRQAELAAAKYEKVAEPEPEPAPAPVIEVEQVEQIPVQQPDLQDEQAAADRAAAAEAAARRAERLAEQRAAEREAARKAAEQAAAEQAAAEEAAAREARQDAKAEAEREAELAAERAAERQAERKAAEREAELAAEQAAAERAAAEQAAAERETARLAAQRRAEREEERLAEERQAEREAAEASASASAAAQEKEDRKESRETTGSASASASASAAPVGGGGSTGSGNDVIAIAQKHLGTPYVLSPPGPCAAFKAEDCSCFTMLVYAELGIALPDDPNALLGYGSRVSGTPMAGDLLFWSEDGSGYVTHVGIAMGDGTTIHASTYTGEVTQGTPIDAVSGYMGARRVL